MKITMTISAEKDIKAEFQAFTKELGTNPTTPLEEEKIDKYFGKILEKSDKGDYVYEIKT